MFGVIFNVEITNWNIEWLTESVMRLLMGIGVDGTHLQFFWQKGREVGKKVWYLCQTVRALNGKMSRLSLFLYPFPPWSRTESMNEIGCLSEEDEAL